MSTGRVALISVWDKSGLPALSTQLWSLGFHVISTGGTYKSLQQCWEAYRQEYPSSSSSSSPPPLSTVSELTGFPEILSGRVKTLHPKIHGALLARRDQEEHQIQLLQHQIPPIDLVVCNLYPFHQAANSTNNSSTSLFDAQELIDIGGVTLIRAAAKNFDQVMVVTSPSDYPELIQRLQSEDPQRSADDFEWRKQLAQRAFLQTTQYDAQISNYLANYQQPSNNDDQENQDHQAQNYQTQPKKQAPDTVVRVYRKTRDLKYGANPHQQPAAVYRQLCSNETQLTESVEVINGNPGFINYLDAYYAWGLVQELSRELATPAAASFKHNSPAGVGLGQPRLSEFQQQLYGLSPEQAESELARAFVRARQADPKSSFGDLIGLSHPCDLATARLICREVSDGVIAPDYEPEALEQLMKKRGGKYLILRGSPDMVDMLDTLQFRDLEGGMALAQPPNRGCIGLSDDCWQNGDGDKNGKLPSAAQRDLILANVALKYAQSNTVCIATQGQVIGLAAGQQSRVDCVKLATNKARLWFLRHLPLLQEQLKFKPTVKRQDRVNAVINYLEGNQPKNLYQPGYEAWAGMFEEDQPPAPLSTEDLAQCQLTANQFATEQSPICLASDAFFPFRDSLDQAIQAGVGYVIQPGGSRNDPEVQQAAEEHGMTMIMSGLRLFTH